MKPASRTAVTQRAEQVHRIGILPTGVGVGKASAEVAERRRTQQRIGERVREHVAVGVSERTAFERNANAAEDQRASLDEPMRIEAVADAHHPRDLKVRASSRPSKIAPRAPDRPRS